MFIFLLINKNNNKLHLLYFITRLLTTLLQLYISQSI